VNKRLKSPVEFVCVPDAQCDKRTGVFFLPKDSKLYVCSSWTGEAANDRIVTMLGAIYGTIAGETDPMWHVGLAKIAQKITEDHYVVPSYKDVVGDATWTKDLLRIAFLPQTQLTNAKASYEESPKKHERLSKDAPVYQGPNCQDTILPFEFDVEFYVDDKNTPRPGPFTRPALSVQYTFETPKGVDAANSATKTESHPQHSTPGQVISANQWKPFVVSLADNGTFHTKFQMSDPETSTVLVYEDRLAVEASRPCQPAPAQPAKPAKPGKKGP
jgi:hypothetical protein